MPSAVRAGRSNRSETLGPRILREAKFAAARAQRGVVQIDRGARAVRSQIAVAEPSDRL
jgi:hypothetical protein